MPMNLPAAKRGDLAQFDGVAWRAITGWANKQVLQYNSATGLLVPHTLAPTDLGFPTPQPFPGFFYIDFTGTLTTFGVGASGLVLTGQGAGADPTWVSPTEASQDAVGAMATNSSKVSLTYVDATPSLTADIIAGSLGPTDIANRTRTLWFSPTDFLLRTGAADLAIRGAAVLYMAWAFDAAASEGIVGQIVIPPDAVTGAATLTLYWTNGGAGTGDVRWLMQMDDSTGGDNINTATGAVTQTVTDTAPALNVLQLKAFSTTLSVTANHLLNIVINRQGADVLDTLTNDAWLIGARLDYTADS